MEWPYSAIESKLFKDFDRVKEFLMFNSLSQ